MNYLTVALVLFLLVFVTHGAFVATCTDRIARSPWCWPWLAVGADAAIGLFLVCIAIAALRRRRARRARRPDNAGLSRPQEK